MISNRDIGFVEHGKDAEIKIDTFNFTRYGLLHGKVVSVSRDAIIKDKPPERNRAAKQVARSRNRASRPARNCSIRRACRSMARRCRSRTGWSTLRPAWR